MRVTSLRIAGFRSFVDSGEISLKQINVLIGANNAGKSSLLRALHLLQSGHGSVLQDVRAGGASASVEISLADVVNIPQWGVNFDPAICKLKILMSSNDRRSGNTSSSIHVNGRGTSGGDYHLPNVEPNHFIVPYLSRRKTSGYGEDVREQVAMLISTDMTNLAAKLSRVSNPQFPTYKQYAESCQDILGFVVTNIPSANGQRPGIYLPSQESLPIDQLGEGVPNIVQFLVNLATSTNKLFLIEEPENDLHPQALRALLELIIKSSSLNQFVISTHSNIVVSHLCGDSNSQLLRINAAKDILPTESKVSIVDQTPSARLAALAELGYAFSDMGLWEGWLILEESSAEWIIRNYLIPFFTPSLKRLRTVSAGGAGNVEPNFSDFNRLALFIHLEPAYLNRAWVRVDGDSVGRSVIEKLRDRYQTWPAGTFGQFTRPQFEYYYPSFFSDQIERVLSIVDSQQKRQAKKDLLLDVIDWLDSDLERARSTLEQSAAEVIEDLKGIEAAFNFSLHKQEAA